MVSIIIPFNNKKYLQDCIANIKKIDYKDYEIIVINDSEERTEEFIESKFQKCYKTEEKTIGVGNARNLGIKKAKGEYIMFVDVDDMINPQILKQMEYYIKMHVEMIKYKMKMKELNGKENIPKQIDFEVTNGQDAFNKLCFEDTMFDSPCLYLIKKELFTRTKLKFQKNMYHEDFGLIPLLIVNSKSFVSVDFYGYSYIQSKNSIMRNDDYYKKIKKVQDKFKHYEILLENIKKYNLNSKTFKNLILYYINSILISVAELKYEDRKKFEEKIKKIYKNIKSKDFKSVLKKVLIMHHLEIYYKIKKKRDSS